MLFEVFHSARTDFCEMYLPDETAGFPSHLHEVLECYLVTRGRVRVTVDEKTYLLGEGEGVLVFPYQLHSYEVMEGGAEVFYCLFSADFASAYMRDKSRLLPTDASFSFPISRLPVRTSHIAKKSFVYDLLSHFEEGRQYQPRKLDGHSVLITRILTYLSENLAGDCSLAAVAAKVGYEYTYLSKYFRQTTGVSLHAYTNALRVAHAKELLTAEPHTPVHIIGERCGYASQRTFDRVFHSVVGESPLDYRHRALAIKKGAPVCSE